MNVLGLKVSGHDPGAALISDGKIVAIGEERLTRIKFAYGLFPELSIDYCLNALDVRDEDVDLIVIDRMIILADDGIESKDKFIKETSGRFKNARIETVNHHDAHAASVFFCSPFEEAAILIIDGSGEWYRSHHGVNVTETETMYHGGENTFSQIYKTTHIKDGKIFPYTFGIGKLYSILSCKYINLGWQSEGKMMGLAPYGNNSFLKEFPFKRWFGEYNDQILCNAKISYPAQSVIGKLKKVNGPKDLYYRIQYAFVHAGRRATMALKQSKLFGNSLFSIRDPKIFEPVRFTKPPRPEGCELPDEYYTNVAYAAQKILEEYSIILGKKLKKITQSENICIAGGVGLNIDANMNYLHKVGFKRIFVQPAASDSGIGLGAALYGWHVILGKERFWEMKSASLGRTYTEKEVVKTLEQYKERVDWTRSENIAKKTAKFIADGKIVGWFQGGAEYGPRALGNRSIVCDASHPDMRDILNESVKHREPWRPFAASILEEKMSEWFDIDVPSPFMLLAANVKKNIPKPVSSVVHVDGTSRLQSVTKEENGRYYEMIKEFENITGIPMVLNTSFNDAGEPIVETPEDALKCFLGTEIDYLILGDYIVSKKDIGSKG